MLKRVAVVLRTEPEVLALSFARMADALGNSLLIVILPLFIAENPTTWLGLPLEAQVGLVISLYGFLFAFAQPAMGAATDRAGRRKPFILAGLVLMALGTLGFLFAESYLWIVLLRCVQGLGVAMLVPATLAIISGVTVKKTRGNAMGVYSTFRMIGFASGPLLGGVLHVYFGFDTAFLVGAGFLSIAFLIVLFTVHDPAAPPPRVRDREPAPSASPPPRGWSLPTATTLVLMASTVVMACSLSMISALEVEFNERLAQTALGFGVAFSALTVSRLFLQIPIGRLSDRAGRKKLIVAGLIALAPLTILFGHVTSTSQLIGLRLLQGGATACISAPAFALAADLARKGGEGRVMSLIAMGFGLGMGFGPLIAGALGGFMGFEVPFYAVGVMSLVVAWMVARWAEESIVPHEVSGVEAEFNQV